MRVTEQWHAFSREVAESSSSGDIQKLSGRGPKQLALGGPA